ncbi:hypothetical protein [Geodermatophilus sabuli]|uniref:PfkB family carbohydrate kinase n=1 Tax=Geodermatophilus sabuli TaxID=1564158 RepID=A0A285EFK0_9ACTN|nr:hypothetical protein [Geodermatophilus sabuli]MBB3086447.1 sugar/nucleoside kinase (ribokinase family) [Geodermatophilus sabuli]SNX97899.1 pfkB family carbohydrate kinase [Geodermatophilus sabuli]
MYTDPPVSSVLGELVVELLPVHEVSAGAQGTAPYPVARPGGDALAVAVAPGRLGALVRLVARLGTGPRVDVVDTVGAGDSLAAGIATHAAHAALQELSDEQLLAIVDDSALVAVLDCTRVSAGPPTREELAAARR